MNLKKSVHVLLGVAMLGSFASADHSGMGGGVQALVYRTGELERTVSYSPLNYNVKNSVFQFANEVRCLARCVEYERRPLLDSRNAEPVIGEIIDDHGGTSVPFTCERELRMTRYSFRAAEQNLYDTAYEFPQIYQSYYSVKGI